MNEFDRNFSLNLARSAIRAKLDNVTFELGKIPQPLKDIGCCFVTLTLNGELRGCIGHLEPFEPLYKNIIDNAINAAFSDSRFPPVSRFELDNLKIEISVLSSPERLLYLNPDDLLNKLSQNQGVILKKGGRSATFLPQVWEMIPNKTEFLENLCQKAGLPQSAWMSNPEIFVYSVVKFSE